MPVPPSTTAATTAPTEPAGSVTAWRVDNLTGADVLADPAPWTDAYETVYADVLHLPDHSAPPFAERLAFSANRPGFRLTACHVDGELAGFAYGYTLPPTTGWWNGFVPLPGVDAEDVTAERPGRTFAMCEALVHAPFRGSGIVEHSMPFFLSGRKEERAAGLVAETNTHARDIFLRNGWQHVGDLAPHPGWRGHHCLLMPLHG
ncbi:GNAT family N-acetyltransferase [Nocardiopsis quinghaiensis]|uniref:GNAT family N-acetyltransferase n=1 Tax=Nocardiopsis quinghaiensis TaxID=464995 RepID=UPI001CC2496B|nr:GNAT family N-acetyltransferase [Nocardiopsis quinghaiensis]